MSKRQSIPLWFLHNPTAANLLMWVFIIGGVIALFNMRQEVFPNAILDTIEIRAEYRGATAAQVEAQVVQPMEQSIDALRDIRTIVSEIQSGGASIFVILDKNADAQRTLDEIQSSINGLNSLPADLEPTTIIQVRNDSEDIELGFYGFQSREELFSFSEFARERLLKLPTVGQVQIDGAGEPEISVRLSPNRARLFGLSLFDVMESIRRASFNLSGGVIRSSTGEYGLSTGLNRSYAHEFDDIAIVKSSTGVPLTLSQIASVENGFRPYGKRYRINGSLGVMMNVFSSGTATPGELSESVRVLLTEMESEVPEIGAVIFDDDAKSFADRVGILANSALIGLVLVLILLFLVLEARFALWVAVGLPVAMLGGVALFALTPYTVNFISVFAFIIVIGVVVDDALVIGESIYSNTQSGMSPLDAAEDTISRFSTPITLAIVTNIIAFTPIFFIPGQLGLFLLAIPVVTTCVFAISLIEALWILPAHLAYSRQYKSEVKGKQRRVQEIFESMRENYFVPWVEWCLTNRGFTIAVGLIIAFSIISWVGSGRVPISLQAEIESEQVSAIYALNPGVSDRQVDEMADKIEGLGRQVLQSLGDEEDIKGIYTRLGSPFSHQGSVTFSLALSEDRPFTAGEFAEQWRDLIGQPAKLTQLSVDYLQGPGEGRDLTIEISHADSSVSRLAAESLVHQLQDIEGVGQISYSGNAFRSEVRFELTALGRALGFDESEISSRLRAQLDGLEATRLTRGNHEVPVMIRGEHGDDKVLPDLSGIILISSSGSQAALDDIAKIHWDRGAVQLRRINEQRIERIEATIDRRIVSKGQVENLVSNDLLPALEAQYPGLTTWDEAIDTNDDAETESGLMLATIGVLTSIFVLIAAYVGSLRLSSILLITLPLSATGALLGHILLGINLSAASFIGILALGGLVINSGLLLQLRYTQELISNASPKVAMVSAVRDRFRPILLSTVTTLVGLAPLIFTTSIQAEAIRPLAVSIGFGMLFSIPIILILLPCIMLSFERGRASAPIYNV